MDLGLVGLPGCGKSELLALLCGGAAGGRLAVAKVPDPRLDLLSGIFSPKKTTPATMRLTELPGLIPGRLTRSERTAFFEGVRRADALLHVVRAFPDPAVPHPAGRIDPLDDARRLEEELILADMEQAETLVARLGKNRARSRDEDLQLAVLQRLAGELAEARPLRLIDLSADERRICAGFGFLTAGGELIACNLGEEDLRNGRSLPELAAWAAEQGIAVVPFSARVENEIAALPPEERQEFLASYGLSQPGVDRLAVAAYGALGLISFLTAGEDEVRAWPIPAGTTARRAAGKIHSDIEKGFIRAEVAQVGELVAARSWKALRDQGLMRLEGKEYVMRDGDVVVFRFNV